MDELVWAWPGINPCFYFCYNEEGNKEIGASLGSMIPRYWCVVIVMIEVYAIMQAKDTLKLNNSHLKYNGFQAPVIQY